jgi:hypothetical protein
MPWTAWKNQEFDWGYEPFHYFAMEARMLCEHCFLNVGGPGNRRLTDKPR